MYWKNHSKHCQIDEYTQQKRQKMKKLEFWIESTFNDYNKKKTVSVCGKFKTRKLLLNNQHMKQI